MSTRKTFQIHLDPELIEEFDASLDAQEHISEQISFVEKAFSKKAYRGVSAWDCICSCVNRIRDTVEYLNDQILGVPKYGSAFDFINFINNASVVLDSIDMLANILGVDLTIEDARTDVFKELGSNGEGTDKIYFQFLRSLCAVHPVETSRYKGKYHETDIVTCPRLTWVRGTPLEFEWDCDLYANALVNDAASWGADICVHMNQVFAYIEYRYDLLKIIGAALERYQGRKIEEYRNTPVPGRGENESEIDYIERLKKVEIERFGSNNASIYDFAETVVTFEPTNLDNKAASERYKNAWRFALGLQLNVLRDMERSGAEHAGIANDDTDWILFEQLMRARCSCDELDGYGYQLEKLGYLAGRSRSSNPAWGRLKLRELEPVFRQYVLMDLDNDSDEELYMLSRIALYEIALRHDCEVNEAIPHDPRYRDIS